MAKAKYTDEDLYLLLGVAIEATQIEIRKAYRKKALECHPDKNPDNPKAAELFHELSKALEILTDESARAAYDKVLKAKKASEVRIKQLDSKRQKLRSDLELREKQASERVQKSHAYSTVPKTDEEIFLAEVERLRNESSKLLEEEQELMRQQLRAEKQKVSEVYDSALHRIKIKWKADKTDDTNGGYSELVLLNFLKKYGEIVAFVLSPKKKGSALVEYKTQDAGEMAIDYERGNLSNPLHLEWIGEPPKTKRQGVPGGASSVVSNTDFEDLVLHKMRQAEERKRLIAQMMKDEEEAGI